MKLLILCNDFPPLNSIGAQRPYSWFRHMKEFGIEPIVITKNWRGNSATPIDVLSNATEDRDVVIERHFDKLSAGFGEGTIIRVPFETTPSERILQRLGEDKYRIVRKALTFIYKALSFLSFRFDKHRQIYIAAKKFLKTNKVDAIIATAEPFILFRYAHRLHKKFHIPWIADYRDGWRINYTYIGKRSMPTRLQLAWEFLFEKKYARSCKLIATVDPYLASQLSKLLQQPVEVIYNGFDNFYVNKEVVTQSKKLILNHTGTLRPAQPIEMLLNALVELIQEEKISSDAVQLNFIGLDYYSDQSKRVKSFNKLFDKIIVSTPRISREEALQKNSEADYLIVVPDINTQIINAKVYDYLAVKRPILVIPEDDGLLTNLMKELQAGESFSNIDTLKKFLYQAVERKKNNMPIKSYPINEEKAIFYTRRRQAEILAAKIKNLVAGS